MKSLFHRQIFCAVTVMTLSVSAAMYGQSRSASSSGSPAAGAQAISVGSGSVSGTIKDTTGAVVPHAQIVLQPGATTAASNAQGDFFIQNVPSGTYTVTISEVGFKNAVSTITVTAGHTTPLNTMMTVASTNQRVEVTANLQGDEAAINEQRTSANILNVVTAPTIRAAPSTPTRPKNEWTEFRLGKLLHSACNQKIARNSAALEPAFLDSSASR